MTAGEIWLSAIIISQKYHFASEKYVLYSVFLVDFVRIKQNKTNRNFNQYVIKKKTKIATLALDLLDPQDAPQTLYNFSSILVHT